MTTGRCAVVWIDEEEGRVAYLGADAEHGPRTALAPGGIRVHRRSKVASPNERRATDDHVFYQKIANDLISARKFLVLGPADAKTKFVKHLHRYDPRLIARLSAIESVERLTDDALLATAQAYFKRYEQQVARSPGFWSI
jgi:stalled ribosome rescue protein Dom34